MVQLKKKAVQGVFWTFFQSLSNQIVGFVISVILARLLVPKDFGLIAMLTIFMGLGKSLSDSGLTQSLIRTKNPDDEDFSTVFYFNLGMSLLIYGLIVMLAPLIAQFYNQNELTSIVRVYSIVLIINALSAVQKTRLTKKMDFKTQMIVSLPSAIISGVVGIVMALFGYGVWSLVWSRIALAMASSAQLWYWSKWRPLLVFSKIKFKQHFKFGYRLTLSAILDTLFVNLYVIIIGKFYPPAQVGFYSKANGLQILPVQLISGIVNKVTYPLFSGIQDDNARLKNVYRRIMQTIIFLVAPTLILLAVLAEPLFRFLYTEKWLPAVPYFQILCVSGVLYPIHAYNLQILNVKGRSDLFLRLEIIKKILLVIVVFVSFKFGIYGLLYGNVIFSIMALAINAHFSGKFINYGAWQQIKDLLPTIIVALLVGVGIHILDGLTIVRDLHDLVRISMGGFIGFVIFVALSWGLKLNALFELLTLIKIRK